MSINRSMANLIDGSGSLADGGGVTVYATKENLPTTGLTSGDQAYVSNTSRLYISNGSGWYNVALINATPSLTIDPTGAIELSKEGASTVITLTATDSDNAVAGLTLSVDSDGNFGGLATISQDSSVFTITPLSEDSATTTSSTLTFKASDGISFGSGTRTLSLTFKVTNSNYTTLLLQADTAGTDNQVDASTSSRTITEGDNITSTSFTPYHPGGYSILYDGNSDSLSVAADTSLDLGTGDFTMEAWVHPTATSNNYPSFMSSVTGWSSGASGHRFDNTGHSGKFGFYVNGFGGRSGGNPFMHSTNTFTHDDWYHYAVTRSGNTFKMYINGVLEDTQTDSGSLNAALGGFRSGGSFDGANGYFAGHVKDVRIVKGSVVYTGAFTPPTSSLTAISGTSLLICHAPYIADGSTNSHAITTAGTTQTRRFSPHDYESYTKVDHGGSVYFDGLNDNLSMASSADFNFGSSDWTIEAWLYQTARDASNVCRWYMSGTNGDGNAIHVSINTNGTLDCGRAIGGGVITGTSTAVMPLNTWNHVVATKEGSNGYLYLNGKQVSTSGSATEQTAGDLSLRIGYDTVNTVNEQFTGYMADVQVIKGTRKYTADFTPPTSPISAHANSVLLTCTNKNDIFDASSASQVMTKSGNVTASNTQRKFATSSAIYFDGSGDYLDFVKKDEYHFSSSDDFTVEGWWYFAANSGTIPFILMGTGVDATPAHYSDWIMYRNGSGNFAFGQYSNTGNVFRTFASFTPTLNTWYHIAVSRSGTDLKGFIDGQQQGSTITDSTAWTNKSGARPLRMGRFIGGGGSSSYFNGYAQSVRITKGLARYTANFTPSTSEFTG